MKNRDWIVIACEIAIALTTAILLIVAIDEMLQ